MGAVKHMRAGGWGYIKQPVCESLSEANTPLPTQVPKWIWEKYFRMPTT